jgi:regulation of enolase protein 1 (concanavalin A-like superfamily)
LRRGSPPSPGSVRLVTDEPVRIDAVPMPLRWLTQPQSWSVPDGASLVVTAGPRTDWFADPQLSAQPLLNAPALVGDPSGEFLLSARVTVDFAATYDAGVLALYASDRVWAKLCFEYSPQREPMVVSVVTRGVSDDCNSFVVDDASVWLRIARIGPAFAFHASTDGGSWSFIRHFALEAGSAPSVGFAAQSPTGEGCAVRFEQIAFEAARLGDLRSGE